MTMNKKHIYLDYAAATPLSSEVLLAMQPFFSEQFYNPSSQHSGGLQSKQALNEARRKVAHWFGAKPSEIIFSAGGTEANNLLISGVMKLFPGANCVVSSTEHDSVIKPAEQFDRRFIKVGGDGVIDTDSLKASIDDKTVLVSIHYANNETGVIQPIRQVAKIINQIRTNRQAIGNSLPLLFHTDACQAPLFLDIHVSSLGVDAMTINAGKIYGPKQTGALYLSRSFQLSPYILGGGQERGIRSGTENLANIVGLSVALDIAQSNRGKTVKNLANLQRYFIEKLTSSIDNVVINGSLKHRLPNNVHITLPGQDNERLMMELDNSGIMCATGSACSASSDEPSHVLRSMGLSVEDARSSLRFTMGQQTSRDDVDTVVESLTLILK